MERGITNWSEIADDISDGAAVLLIGPEAIRMLNTNPYLNNSEATEILFSTLCSEVIREKKDISHKFFENERFFLFKDSHSKKKAKRIVSNVIRDTHWRPNSELLDKIACLQFPVVINVSPDTFLRETYIRYGIRHQYDYYSIHDNKIETSFDEPSDKNPILFNLCGSTEDFNSLILDYHDLFKLIKNLLSETKFPQRLKFALKNATTFVFLGFQFDRWYAQMMLHYLNMLDNEFDNSSNNYSMLTSLKEDATFAFVAEQFNVKYIGASLDDFEHLFKECSNRQILRQLSSPYSEKATEVRLKVAANDIVGALHSLEQYGIDANTILGLQSRLTHWELLRVQKVHSFDELDRLHNQIRYAILELTTDLI